MVLGLIIRTLEGHNPAITLRYHLLSIFATKSEFSDLTREYFRQ
jgi:hypothetical protein